MCRALKGDGFAMLFSRRSRELNVHVFKNTCEGKTTKNHLGSAGSLADLDKGWISKIFNTNFKFFFSKQILTGGRVREKREKENRMKVHGELYLPVISVCNTNLPWS